MSGYWLAVWGLCSAAFWGLGVLPFLLFVFIKAFLIIKLQSKSAAEDTCGFSLRVVL